MKKPPSWSEITGTDRWQNLDQDQKQKVLSRWTQDVVAGGKDLTTDDLQKITDFSKNQSELITNSNVGNVEGVGRSLLEGMTFGAGKYAEAALETALPSRHGSKLPFQGKSFSENLKELEQRNQTYGEEHPIASTVANIAGNVAVPIGGAGRLATTLTGAGIGAVQAASDADDLSAAVPGAIGGAVIGAVTPSLLNVAGKGIGAAASFVKRATLGAKPDEIIGRYLAGKTDLAKNLLQEGEENLLTDIPKLGGLSRNVLKRSPESQAIVESALNDRSAGGIERGVQAAQEFTTPYFNNLQKTVQGFKDKAQAAYSNLFQNQEPIVNEKINSLMQNEEIQRAVKSADALYRASEKEVPDLMEGIPLGFADEVKKQLDKIANDAYASNNSQAGDIYAKFASQWRKALDTAVPEYAEVRELAKPYKQIEAVMAKSDVIGNKLVTEPSLAEKLMKPGQTPRDVTNALDGLTTLQKAQVKMDLADYLQKNFQNKKQNFGTSVFSPAEKQKIENIIGNPKEFDNFIKSIQREEMYARTSAKVRGNSNTDIYTAQANQLPVGALITNPIKTGMAGLWDMLQARANGLTQENTEALANILTNRQMALEALERIDKSKAQGMMKQIDEKTIQELFKRLVNTGTSQAVQGAH